MNLKPSANGKRKKIWEIPTPFHCSILGTCIDKRDMKKLAVKLKIKADSNFSPVGWEHSIHSHMVNCCAERNRESKYINKYLDRKFSSAVKTYSRINDDDSLAKQFRRDKENGEIRGAYWALMTHPSASEDLILGIYGELHMLAHHLVPKHFKENARMLEMKHQIDSLQQAMARMAKEKAAIKREAEEKIAELRLQAQSARKDKAVQHDGRSGEVLTKMNKQEAGNVGVDDGPAKCQSLNDKLVRNLKKENKRLAHLLEKSRAEIAGRSEEINHLRSQISFLKSKFHKIVQFNGCGCKECNTENCPGPDLCGRRLLYVGGRHHLVPHYKELARKYGAELLHHDGGREASVSRLPSLLSRADAVLCPMDCVSHEACLCIKKIAKKMGKSFVPIRSSGISSLAKCLEDLGRDETRQ